MKVEASRRAVEYIRKDGAHLWVWLDRHALVVGSYTYLEAHTEPPRTSRKTKFTRASRRPHTFEEVNAGEFVLHFDHGRLDPPELLQIDLKGWRNKRIEAYWNGCVFVDDDVPPPVGWESARA
jgi:hypothetical protein